MDLVRNVGRDEETLWAMVLDGEIVHLTEVGILAARKIRCRTVPDLETYLVIVMED